MKITKEKKDYIHFRISADDKLLLEFAAAKCNMSTSRYLQMLIDKALVNYKTLLFKGDLTYADIEAFFDYQLQFRKFFKS